MTTGGEVTSSLTGAYPYIGLELVPERLSFWVAGGYGLGGLRLTPAGGEALETGIGLLAGAAGLRGTVVPAAATGGFSLGLNADGLLLRATSEAAPGLAATTADVNRVRLGLEGAYAVALGDGARLTPSVDVGVRRDGGTAEKGFGMDLGGGLSFTHPRLGLSLGLRGRALVRHEITQLADWGANGSGRVDAKFGYGMPLAGGVGVPWAGIGVSERAHEYRLGYAFQAGDPSATDLRVELVAARREPTNAAPEHTLSVQSTVSW